MTQRNLAYVMQTCPGCGQAKALTDEFWHHDRRSKNGFNRLCKVCVCTERREQGKRGDFKKVGNAAWTPRPDSEAGRIFAALPAVFNAYAADLPLTVRQCYYRLVAEGVVSKTASAYKSVAYVLKRARRAGKVPWEYIRDDTANVQAPPWCYASVTQFIRTHTPDPEDYVLSLLPGQPLYIEILCEAGGMAGMLAAVAHPYGIQVVGSGGYDSVTAKHDLYERIRMAGKPAVILHLGDCDLHGKRIFRAVDRDVVAFGRQEGLEIEFVRVALTPEQVTEFGLEDMTNPDKETEVQLEAVDPPLLKTLLQDAITEHWDDDAHWRTLEQQDQGRAQLADWITEHGFDD